MVQGFNQGNLSRHTIVKTLYIQKLSKVWWESGVVVMPILTQFVLPEYYRSKDLSAQIVSRSLDFDDVTNLNSFEMIKLHPSN